MEWYKNLYVGEKVQKNKENLIQKIESGKTPVNIYLITLSSTEQNQLELIPSVSLRFWYSDKPLPLILGLASGKAEAVRLVQKITEDVLKKTGGLDIKNYFK